jgi:inner membrane protein
VPLTSVVSTLVRHCTLTHSLAVTVALNLLLFGMGLHVPVWLATGIVVGWLSHWLFDLLNSMGVQLFCPLPLWIKLPVPFLAVSVDSPAEVVIRLLLQLYGVVLRVSYVLLHLLPAVRETAKLLLPYAAWVVETFSWPWLVAACHVFTLAYEEVWEHGCECVGYHLEPRVAAGTGLFLICWLWPCSSG